LNDSKKNMHELRLNLAFRASSKALKTASYGLWFIFLAAAFSSNALSEEETYIDYSDWYQVEVILFSPLQDADFGESWPLLEKSYPTNMVTISPENDESIKPYNLTQLEQLETMASLTQSNETTENNRQEEFMFEGRSLHNQTEVVTGQELNSNARNTDSENTASDDNNSDNSEQLDDEVRNINSLNKIEHLLYPLQPESFQQLKKDERFLEYLARSLKRSSKYRFLTHLAWRQPIRAADDPTPILIQTGDHFDDYFMIDGTLTISRSRYLHVNTDLWATQFTPKYSTGSTAGTTANIDRATAEKYPEIAKWEQGRDQQIPIQSFPMKQSRRMRSATLHYIDHPLFGILIQVNKYEGEQVSALLN
jgi:hypothetical protein